MRSCLVLSWLCSFLLLGLGAAQTASSTSATDAAPPTDSATSTSQPAATTDTATGSSPSETTPPPESSTTTTEGGGGGGSSTTTGNPSYGSNPPDVWLKVPELHVGRIELDVDNLRADLNLAAEIANLVQINAGVQVGIQKVNITIADVDANVDLIIRLGNLVDIVNRTLESLNLNPLLINILNEATELVDAVIGAVDGLLGSIVNGDSTVNFLIDNLGNIVQEVQGTAGTLLNTIVGDFNQNMTFTGAQEILDGGLVQKTYAYDPLSALVNIVFNSAGQVVQAVVVKGGSNGGSSSSTVASTPAPTSTAPAR